MRAPTPFPLNWILPLCALALATGTPASAADLMLSGMTYVGSKAGTKSLVLRADVARIDPTDDVAYLEEVSLDAADDDGETSLIMTCDKARLLLGSSDFYAEGNVEGETADGHRFTTTRARFEHGKRLITTDAPVSILDSNGTRFRGAGFRYDVQARRMKLLRAQVEEVE